MCYQHAPQPNWVQGVTVKGSVLSVRDGCATLRYEGTLSSRRRMPSGEILSTQELKLEGEGVFDLATEKMQSLLLVGTGTFRWPVEAPGKVVPFDALIEWDSSPQR